MWHVSNPLVCDGFPLHKPILCKCQETMFPYTSFIVRASSFDASSSRRTYAEYSTSQTCFQLACWSLNSSNRVLSIAKCETRFWTLITWLNANGHRYIGRVAWTRNARTASTRVQFSSSAIQLSSGAYSGENEFSKTSRKLFRASRASWPVRIELHNVARLLTLLLQKRNAKNVKYLRLSRNVLT